MGITFLPRQLIEILGGMYSRELGIDFSGLDRTQIFRWLLAAKLMGARISTRTALATWREFYRRGVDTPEGIQQAGWDVLVAILDSGGYTRYDFSTATKLLAIVGDLIDGYGGDLNALHDRSEGPRDLETRVMGLGKGIGVVTANIFLRELRAVWRKADPPISPLALLAARDLDLAKGKGDPMYALRQAWASGKVREFNFSDFETALVRLGKDYCRKPRAPDCPMRKICPKLRSAGT